MPRSSFFIQVVNAGPDLTRKDFGLEHGIWSSGSDGGDLVPPERIPHRSRAHWESEASDELTGTQGHALYSSDAGDVGFFWDAQFIRSNSFRVNHSPSIQASWGDISGNNAAVTVTLIDNF
jgi:hypothetical protein